MATEREKLFSEFPPVSKEEWVEKVTADLKGADFDKKLVWRTSEGFNLQPMYRREDIQTLASPYSLPNEYPFVRSTKMNNEWRVRQDIVVENISEAHTKALGLLTKGVNSLGFKLKKSDLTASNFDALLEGIDLTSVEVNIICCVSRGKEATELFVDYVQRHGIDTQKVEASIAYIPFKRELIRGIVSPDIIEEIQEIIQAAKPLPNLRVLTIDGATLNNAGAYIHQELGYALSWGADLLHQLTEAGVEVEEICRRIKFNWGISANYFMEIAKFRAARWLWAEIVGAYGDQYKNETAKIHQHAVTSMWNMTLYDAYVNLLRTQTEAMSAAIAGVDSITVLPFNAVYETPTDFSERIARNQQLLISEESHFDKVIDPASGSYYIETLTQNLAEKAWALFMEVEEAGGFSTLVRQGDIQKAVNASNKKRHEAVAKRKETLLGTNEFPNFSERALETLTPIYGAGSACSCDSPQMIEKLDFSRGASEFETLRLSTERNKQPIVFMLTIGNLAMRLARSQFAGNFFGCAGYKLIDNLGFETVEEGIQKAMEAKADVVVLCSSDDEYETYAPEAFKLLNGRAQFVVAGNPACTDQLKEVGIEHFIHVKSNVLETLQAFNHLFHLEA